MQRKRHCFLARAAMTLLLGLLTVSMAWADEPGHKIVVIADPHVMDDGLLTNTSNADWTTYIAGSRKLIDYSKTLFDQAVSDIEDLWPKLVLIVGDLTKDGEQASHNYVKGKLDYLKNLGIPTLVIPGNHDLGTADAKVYGETTTDAETLGTAAAFASLYADYGYGASSDRLENTLTYACEPIEGLMVIGIDSGTDGVLSDATLNWVCAKATAARAAGKQVIAMMHHPLIPHITGGDMFVETVSVANYETVRNRLADAGITTIFTGHFHTSDIAKDWNGDKSKTIYDVNTGSLCSYPCDYRVVTLNNDLTAMSIATSTATGDNTITADDAKKRLKTSMASMIEAKLLAEYGYMMSFNSFSFADAYIFHAEGNENLSQEAASTLTSFQTILGSAAYNGVISKEQYNSFSAMFNSMLQDKSNYGDADREDQTNDRTLDVSMPVSVVTPVDIKYLDPTASIGQQRKTATDALAITSSTTAIGTANAETWYYVSGMVTNDNRIEVSGTVNLILEDGCDFTVSKGIHVASGNALNIYAQSVANRGLLTADNYCNDAAIGGNGGEDGTDTNATAGEDSGAITIYGGTITTFGNIGGGDGGNGTMEPGESSGEPGYGGKGGNGNVTIYSGKVHVSDNIGGGNGGKGQDELGGDDPNKYGSNGGGTVNLSWTTASDVIRAYNYYSTVTLQKAFNVGNEVHDAGTLNYNQDINDKTLMHAGDSYTVTIGDMPDGVTATADLELNAGWRNAVEGQVVTICISGVPVGKVPVVYYDYLLGSYPQHDLADNNGDGTYSFVMPATDVNGVTITAELKKNIATCTATVPDQLPNGNSLMFYKFENANYGYTVIGETVKDGETTLTLGKDYDFGSVTFANGNRDPKDVGDECRVEIRGKGDYSGTTWAYFTIVNPSGSGTWGSLSWALEDGTLTISGTGDMAKPQNNGTYPWLTYKSYIETITIGENVTSIADGAFATAQNDYHYAVSTVNLPSTLESIGEDAFAYCTGATITIPASVTSIADGAFKEVLKVESSLYDNADNTGMISLLAEAKKNDVTLQGRTLWKDGEWNTICLPFDMDAAQVTAQLGPDALKELDVEGYYNVTTGNPWPGNTGYDGYRQTGFDATSGTLYLYFKDATSIEAGKPYLIKWDNGEDLKDPKFTDVKVWDYAPTDKAVTSNDNNITFKGTYTSTTFTEDDNTKLFVGTDNKLNYPKIGARIGAFRAYFQLSEELRVKSEESPVKEFRLNFGEDEATPLLSPEGEDRGTSPRGGLEGVIYNLSGQRVSKMQKGINIVNGKKIFIK